MNTSARLSAPSDRILARLSVTIFLAVLPSATAVTIPLIRYGSPSELFRPMYVTAPTGDINRLFIAEKSGTIKLLNLATGVLNPTPFLTISDTDDQGHGGLQSIAFHPDFFVSGSNGYGKFYAYVTVDNGGQMIDGVVSPFSSHIRQYSVSDPMAAVANPVPTEVLSWVKPEDDHNGGWIGFNPKVTSTDEQYLYIRAERRRRNRGT